MPEPTIKPRYPVYIVSKGRYGKNALTANFMVNDQVDFKLVVEPQEADEYAKSFGHQRLLVLPFSNLGLGSIPARNWIWEHSISIGAQRHWIFDDNIRRTMRRDKAQRLPCNANIALAAIEDFVDRYTNIAIAGMNYKMFCPDNRKKPPFVLNCHVYSNLLIKNDIITAHNQSPIRWRGRYNEDTDLCLQVLSNNYCTVQLNAFLIDKVATMTTKGGNTDELYQGDGRLRMARSLERDWPGITETKRRFQRPQHVIKNAWKHFDTPLIRKPDAQIPTQPNNYGMILKQVKPEVKSSLIRSLLNQNQPNTTEGSNDKSLTNQGAAEDNG
jgi:hypothetical protein